MEMVKFSLKLDVLELLRVGFYPHNSVGVALSNLESEFLRVGFYPHSSVGVALSNLESEF